MSTRPNTRSVVWSGSSVRVRDISPRRQRFVPVGSRHRRARPRASGCPVWEHVIVRRSGWLRRSVRHDVLSTHRGEWLSSSAKVVDSATSSGKGATSRPRRSAPLTPVRKRSGPQITDAMSSDDGPFAIIVGCRRRSSRIVTWTSSSPPSSGGPARRTCSVALGPTVAPVHVSSKRGRSSACRRSRSIRVSASAERAELIAAFHDPNAATAATTAPTTPRLESTTVTGSTWLSC